MKILIVGSGGREHALAWKLSQSCHQPTLYFAPGNPGMEPLGQRLEIEVTDIEGLCLFAQRETIDLTVVGPELPLSLGLGDRFRKAGLAVFGPNADGAKVEASKHYAKTLMEKAGVPTAGFAHCETLDAAQKALEAFSPPYVIKEDGLAAGKGVTIAQTKLEAEAALVSAFSKQMTVVIEEFMTGEELSVLAICDGQCALPMLGAQDFKRIGEQNTGPNTGGMGAYAPVPFATPAMIHQVQKTVLDPMMTAFQAEGIDYRGVLYAGLMVDNNGSIRVVEFNARFGDPETQVVLPLLEDDPVDVLLAAAKGDLSDYASGLSFKRQCAVTVVLASQGYPGDYETGKAVTLPAQPPTNTVLFQAGTRKRPDQTLTTSGGRVFNATGFGNTLAEARQNAYALADCVSFEGKTLRRDIALEVAAAVTTTP